MQGAPLVVFCKFFSNRLEFFDETLQLFVIAEKFKKSRNVTVI